MSDTTTEVKNSTTVKTKPVVKEPNNYNVIYLNDDKTTMEFVIASLMTVFHYSYDSAYELTMQVHEAGYAVVATLPYEIAEEKGIQVTLMARNNGFPLEVKIEQE